MSPITSSGERLGCGVMPSHSVPDSKSRTAAGRSKPDSEAIRANSSDIPLGERLLRSRALLLVEARRSATRQR